MKKGLKSIVLGVLLIGSLNLSGCQNGDIKSTLDTDEGNVTETIKSEAYKDGENQAIEDKKLREITIEEIANYYVKNYMEKEELSNSNYIRLDYFTGYVDTYFEDNSSIEYNGQILDSKGLVDLLFKISVENNSIDYQKENDKSDNNTENTVTYYCSDCGKAIVMNVEQDAVDICNDCANKPMSQDPLIFTGCTNCGSEDHRAIDCPDTSEVCAYCGENGHSENECYNKAYDEELNDEWNCPVCGTVNTGQGLCISCGN